ncbi:MAG: acyltransferase family protein [Oscillospiraceae bacterium]|nr:acyltransferase family protein [Oscillospiraceae bacterium]
MVKKRMASIELARIVACFFVICLHTVTWYTKGDTLLENSLFIRCFVVDPVPVFWYIMGYFLFANPDSSHTLRAKKTVSTLLLPAFGVMIFSQVWQDWILADIGQVSFLSCLDMHSFDLHDLLGNILVWKADMALSGHLWYIFSYVQVLMWAPLLSFMCADTPKANKCRRYLMILTALYVINRDVQHLGVLTIQDQTYPLTIPTVISTTVLFVLMGYETYQNREWFGKNARWLQWCGAVGFVLFALLKYALSVHDMRIDTSDTYFLGTSTICGYLASYCLFVALYCTPFKADSKAERMVLHLGSKSLGIYLIHLCVVRKFEAIGLRGKAYTFYRRMPDNLLIEILSTVAYAVLVFAVSYAIVMVFHMLKQLLKRIFVAEDIYQTKNAA